MDDYDAGTVNGLKLAFELVGKLAKVYEDGIDCGEDWPEEEKTTFKKELQAQVNACRYAQHVIRKGVWEEEEELPW
tara:strand:- start:299 stop:526 length:228 start_codon:yes stop_codon:yes gene_type:complete